MLLGGFFFGGVLRTQDAVLALASCAGLADIYSSYLSNDNSTETVSTNMLMMMMMFIAPLFLMENRYCVSVVFVVLCFQPGVT